MFNGNNLPHEWLLKARNVRKAIENNVSTDIKLPRAQIFKRIQSGDF